MMKEELYPAPKTYPYIPGFEAYVQVVKVADKKYEHLLNVKGNAIFGEGQYGGYASYSICRVKTFFPLSFEPK